ncbi:tetratricopeptide repeat protein [Lishizhenia sp.]|uniref:tetratricopeptide repeat protein n=1 Tax=Lishizhenia sp. TaxID=2497594 RepID=UPI00299D8DF7|nr:tetratricopeptide repeat protein [Lishizhenia sp.]MDX1445280.1 tetratricopeptide repeat protein [Lishizhenia sp.]
MNIFKNLVLGTSLVLTTGAIAQNSNVVNAALEYRDYNSAIQTGKVNEAKTSLLAAKKYIDEAIVHADTKQDGKANWYYGMIYSEIMQVAGMTGDTTMMAMINDEVSDKALKALNFAITSPESKGKTVRGAEAYVEEQKAELMRLGGAAFEAKQFQGAYMVFKTGHEFSEGVNSVDPQFKEFAIVAAQNAVDTLVKQGDTIAAYQTVDEAISFAPESVGLTLAAVDIAIAGKDYDKANDYFNKVLKYKSDNAELFYSYGSIMYNANRMDDAINVLEKAIALDSQNADYNYILGASYLEKAKMLQREYGNMDIDDPRMEEAEKAYKAMYTKAITPFEIYLEATGENAQILRILMQASRQAGDTEKALSYKKRMEAL